MRTNGGHRYRLIQALNVLETAANDLRNGNPDSFHVSCMNCDHFNSLNDADYCNRHNAKPPARIIAYGCNDWINCQDDVPF